jgi:hypothetical protein
MALSKVILSRDGKEEPETGYYVQMNSPYGWIKRTKPSSARAFLERVKRFLQL